LKPSCRFIVDESGDLLGTPLPGHLAATQMTAARLSLPLLKTVNS
jgi:hypothetical protein